MKTVVIRCGFLMVDVMAVASDGGCAMTETIVKIEVEYIPTPIQYYKFIRSNQDEFLTKNN